VCSGVCSAWCSAWCSSLKSVVCSGSRVCCVCSRGGTVGSTVCSCSVGIINSRINSSGGSKRHTRIGASGGSHRGCNNVRFHMCFGSMSARIMCFMCCVHDDGTVEGVKVGMVGGGERGVFCEQYGIRVQQVQCRYTI